MKSTSSFSVLNFMDIQLLHRTFPWLTFKLGALILVLQTLHTNTFLIILANASSNLFAIVYHLFNLFLTCFITFAPMIVQYKTSFPSLTSPFNSSGISISKVSYVSMSTDAGVIPGNREGSALISFR